MSEVAKSRSVASLGMYDLPELTPATDALWAGIARHLAAPVDGGVPVALDRRRPLETIWRDPDLLLAQTCGAPYVAALADTVRLVAIPVYDAPGCEAVDGRSAYRSAVIARRGGPVRRLADLAGATVAVNDPGSHSGCIALRASLLGLARGAGDPVVGRVVRTGSHRASLRAVAAGTADAAAIDAVTLALLHDAAAPEAAAVDPIAWTDWAPPLPFIAAGQRSDREVAALYRALGKALTDRAVGPALRRLRLIGRQPAEPARYDRVRRMIAQAAQLGDWTGWRDTAMHGATGAAGR